MSVKHKTLPPGTDRPGFGGITPSLYAEEHAFSGGAQGSVLTRNTLNSDGAGWVAAADGVLMSTGVGVLPTFSATLSNTIQNNITRVGTLVAGATGAGFTVALTTSTITGTLADARLSSNVPLKNVANTFSVANTATAALVARFNSSNPLMGIILANSNGFPYLGFNTISQVSSDTPKYDITGFAAQLRMDNGTFTFSTAPSGTAGNAITLTSQMSLSNAGVLTLSTLNGNGLAITPSTVTNGAYVTYSNTGGTSFIGLDNSTGTTFGTGSYGLALFSASATGITLKANDAAGEINFKTGGNNRRCVIDAAGAMTWFDSNGVTSAMVFDVASAVNSLQIASTANGTGNITGNTLIIGCNLSGGGAPGLLQLVAKDAGGWVVWVDTTGVLRISSAAPQEDGTPSDTSGTIVGLQSSTRASKHIYEQFTDNVEALRTILSTPLYRFRYANGAYNNQDFVGIVTDDSPVFGMDEGRSFNSVSAFGYTVAAIQELARRVDVLSHQTEKI